jgi:Zn-dependent protease
MQYLIIVPVILMSIIIHEVSHGVAALLLGDDTAKRYGRLSLNPMKHIDLFGTVILPILLLISTRGALVFGYAKPVPLNPYNFKDLKRDTGLSAAAGPASNFIIAILFSILIRILSVLPYHPYAFSGRVMSFVMETAFMIVFFNLLLGCFNLIPFPPLDGSKVLGIFLPDHLYYPYMRFERKGMLVFMGIILASYLFGWNLIGRIILPPINILLRLLTGYGLF